jgi:hypothetical protein
MNEISNNLADNDLINKPSRYHSKGEILYYMSLLCDEIQEIEKKMTIPLGFARLSRSQVKRLSWLKDQCKMFID